MPPPSWDLLESLSSSEVAAILSLGQPLTLREGEESCSALATKPTGSSWSSAGW